MAKYVDLDKVIETLEYEWGYEGMREDLYSLPAAEVAPVVRGCWSLRCDSRLDQSTGEYDEDFYLECSVCHRKVWDINQGLAVSGEWAKLIEPYPYCHCGAKMDGGSE